MADDWTTGRVQDRLELAADVFRALPGVKPQGYFSAWPEYIHTHWQQRMRGALSQLPMASGPWIWRPTDQAQRPAQMTLFEGLGP